MNVIFNPNRTTSMIDFYWCTERSGVSKPAPSTWGCLVNLWMCLWATVGFVAKLPLSVGTDRLIQVSRWPHIHCSALQLPNQSKYVLQDSTRHAFLFDTRLVLIDSDPLINELIHLPAVDRFGTKCNGRIRILRSVYSSVVYIYLINSHIHILYWHNGCTFSVEQALRRT